MNKKYDKIAFMKTKFFKNYFSIVFVVATFLGVFHHHNDFKIHNNCQICTIQSSIAGADVPVQKEYITEIQHFAEATLAPLFSLIEQEQSFKIQARAPPYIS